MWRNAWLATASSPAMTAASQATPGRDSPEMPSARSREMPPVPAKAMAKAAATFMRGNSMPLDCA